MINYVLVSIVILVLDQFHLQKRIRTTSDVPSYHYRGNRNITKQNSHNIDGGGTNKRQSTNVRGIRIVYNIDCIDVVPVFNGPIRIIAILIL